MKYNTVTPQVLIFWLKFRLFWFLLTHPISHWIMPNFCFQLSSNFNKNPSKIWRNRSDFFQKVKLALFLHLLYNTSCSPMYSGKNWLRYSLSCFRWWRIKMPQVMARRNKRNKIPPTTERAMTASLAKTSLGCGLGIGLTDTAIRKEVTIARRQTVWPGEVELQSWKLWLQMTIGQLILQKYAKTNFVQRA